MEAVKLNDKMNISVNLKTNDWNTVIDWLVHTPYSQAKEITKNIGAQIKERYKEEDKEFTIELPIETYNLMIFALGMAPYYQVVTIIQEIYTQGQKEIKRLKSEHEEKVLSVDLDVEKTGNSPNNNEKSE